MRVRNRNESKLPHPSGSPGLEELQPGVDHLAHRADSVRKNLVRGHLIRISRKGGFQSFTPGEANLGVDVNDRDSRFDRLQEVLVVCSGATMEGQRYRCRLLDLANSLDV